MMHRLVELGLFKVIVVVVLVSRPLESAAVVSFQQHARSEWEADWNAIAQASLQKALRYELNKNVAKNVILFLGDGMGVSTVTAGRIYAAQRLNKTGEEASLSFDKFPHVALAKTYNVDHQVPDSAGTATAFLCGVKANMGTVGVNQKVLHKRCNTMAAEHNVDSILRWSLAEGKRAGVVTTTRVTHATPSASYAHSADRDWEGSVPPEDRNNLLCVDIAYQLINNNKDINVILGGGRQVMMPTNSSDPEYPNIRGKRVDGLNLIETWKAEMTKANKAAAYVWNMTMFDNVNTDTTDYLLGLFEPSHMQYTIHRPQQTPNEPTLAKMTEKAIKILRREKKGYFLLVEGGRIDHGHHDNSAKLALSELDSFNDAIQRAVDMTNVDDTLIIVTADHSHTFTVGGYPSRGNPILGLVDPVAFDKQPATDHLPYLTLAYANGASANRTMTSAGRRANLTGVDTTADTFLQQSLVPMSAETHGGEDVAIFAVGPMSHLFHGVQEQHYIAHAMAYASCVGNNKAHCQRKSETPSVANRVFPVQLVITVFVVFLLNKLVLRWLLQ